MAIDLPSGGDLPKPSYTPLYIEQGEWQPWTEPVIPPEEIQSFVRQAEASGSQINGHLAGIAMRGLSYLVGQEETELTFWYGPTALPPTVSTHETLERITRVVALQGINRHTVRNLTMEDAPHRTFFTPFAAVGDMPEASDMLRSERLLELRNQTEAIQSAAPLGLGIISLTRSSMEVCIGDPFERTLLEVPVSLDAITQGAPISTWTVPPKRNAVTEIPASKYL
jgi:hypothetical protein